MIELWLKIAIVLLFAAIVFIVLFGDLPAYRGTFIHSLNILLNKIPKKASFIFHAIDNKYFNGILSSPEVSSMTLSALKWFVPGFYFIVMGSCLNLFFKYTFPQILKYDTHTNWSFRIYFIIIPILTSNLLLFLFAVFTDPGHVTQYDKHLEIEFPYDNLLYFEAKKCSTCKIPKPARSKHCGTCNRCILMFDHHCIWLNNDVGYYNYRFFFGFIVSTTILLTYGCYLCFYSLQCYILYEKSLPPSFTQGWLKYWRVTNSSTWENEISGILLMMAVLITPVIYAFLCEHLKQIYLGVTTNELMKWDDISDLMKMNILFSYDDIQGHKIFLVLNKTNWDGSRIFITLRDRSISNVPYEQLTRITSWEDLTNIYDRGFWKNLKYRMFPV